MSTVQVRVTRALLLPAPSLAMTWNVWVPWDRPVRVLGDVHVVNTTALSEQENVADSLEVNSNVADVLATVPLGALVTVVTGTTLSTVQFQLEIEERFPLESTARTSKV